MDRNDPSTDTLERVDEALAGAKQFVEDFGPDLIVLYAPDHYNGFFYDLMPAFCIGMTAESIGDYGTAAGRLDVDRAAAAAIARDVLDAEIDIAVSERMVVDHGFSQPLEILLGGIDLVPTVPIFVNCVASPLGPVRRVRLLGRAVGSALASVDSRRVLAIGSGGLSHDPPVPKLETATPDVAERLIAGRNPSKAERDARERRVTEAGRAFAAGSSTIQSLNPAWDNDVLDLLESGDLQGFDAWSNDYFVEQAGNSSHEVRTSIAAYATLASSGHYDMRSRFYEPIPEWIAGFAVTTAVSG